MIGTLAGDVIGSPYRFHNLEDISRFVGWNLFEENRHFFFEDRKGSRLSADEFRSLAPSEQKRCRPRELTYSAASTLSNEVHEVTGYLLGKDKGQEVPDTLTEPLAIGVSCGEWARTADEAVRLAQDIARHNQLESHGLNGAMMCAHAVWMASHGHDIRQITDVMNNIYGLHSAVADEHSMLLKGAFRRTSEGRLELSDGVKTRDLALVIPAALYCASISMSYEEAVRRAAALGGDSSLVCAMTGALSEHVFTMPQVIGARMRDYLSADVRNDIEVFETSSRSTAPRLSDKKVVDDSLLVIRQGAKTPVYVIPEGRLDMEAAVGRVNRSSKRDTVIIRPSQLQETLETMGRFMGYDGSELSGTFVDMDRPECYRLWLQDGKLKSSLTRAAVGDEKLPPLDVRSANANAFESLKEYANEVRTSLERQAGYDGSGHLHFARAFYPVVKHRSIDLMQGDVLRGRVRIDDNGKIRVDTNVSTGSNTGEYLEGVLNSMDIFHKNDGPAEIRHKLDEYCLDYGKIEDEDERQALSGDDAEAASVKMKYASNVDRAIMDLGQEKELAFAVGVQLTGKEFRHLETLERQRMESQRKYEGKSRSEAVDSTRHQGSVFTVGHSNYSAEEFQALLKRFGIDTVIDVRSFPKSQNFPHFNAETLKENLEGTDIAYRYSGKEMGGHMMRTKDERFNLYMLESDTRKPEYKLFHNDAECVDYCKAFNKTIPVDARFTTYMAMTDKQIEEFVKSKDCSKEFATEIQVYTGKVVTYEEAISRASFKDELKAVRELTRDGHRVVLMGTSGDPETCHRFSMLGHALAHPIDGRIKPLDVQHITRKGTLLSQDFLERKVVKAYGLSEAPNGLQRAMNEKCLANLTKKRDDQAIKMTRKDDKGKSLKR